MNKDIKNFYNSIRGEERLNTFVIFTRYLIAFAFIPSGLKKIVGERFTQLSTETPTGLFLEALYRSGFYWNFLGWAQVLSAFLLMTQRFAAPGAVFFFFIISNIWVITISLSFSCTWLFITFMLLAVLLLLVWDLHKLKYLFYPDNSPVAVKDSIYLTDTKIWVVTGLVLFVLSITGLLLLENPGFASKSFSRMWMAGMLLTVIVGFYLNKKVQKRVTAVLL